MKQMTTINFNEEWAACPHCAKKFYAYQLDAAIVARNAHAATCAPVGLLRAESESEIERARR